MSLEEIIAVLSDVAEVALEDLTSGLDDGTYEEDCINGWTSEQIEEAIGEARRFR